MPDTEVHLSGFIERCANFVWSLLFLFLGPISVNFLFLCSAQFKRHLSHQPTVEKLLLANREADSSSPFKHPQSLTYILYVQMDQHFPRLLQVLILSPYETGMKPKETMWNITRSASLTVGDTTSLREYSLTHYRSLSNTIQVCGVQIFLLTIFSCLLSFIIHHSLLTSRI